RRLAERGDDRLAVAFAHRARRDPALAERLLGGRDGAPRLLAARDIVPGQRAVAVPGARHARLPARMGELNRGDCALFLDESRNPGKTGDVSVVPDAGVAVGDAAALLDRGRLEEHRAGAALGELAEVH